jgi:hypothetical protein
MVIIVLKIADGQTKKYNKIIEQIIGDKDGIKI